jgi:two-component system chemotaxis response regulator CheB
MYFCGQSAASQPGYAVVIAASAGGIEALSEFTSYLPEQLPAPLLVAQHLARDRKSHLREVLQRRTALEVRWAEDGMRFAPGELYLAPPNSHLSVRSGGMLAVCPGTNDPEFRPSADVLFRSAATVFGKQTIGIVLTGCLNDGAVGAAAIRKEGGRIFVQDPELCPYSSMPLAAIQLSAVDLVLPLRALAAAVTAITMVRGATGLFSVHDTYRAALAHKAHTNPDRYYLRVPSELAG